MILKNQNLDVKLRVIISLFIIINICGIAYFLKNLSLDIIYQQISSIIVIMVIWTICIVLIRKFFQQYIINPLKRAAEVSKLASVGSLSDKVGYYDESEIGQISSSIDSIIHNQLNLAEFTEKIGDGDFDVEYKVLSEQDKLGYSITGMRDKLQKVAIEEKSRNWISAGFTSFNEILRQEETNLSVLCDKFLSALVKYIDANQGMIFLLKSKSKESGYLELEAAYAWNRKKYINKKIEIGEGLIGQVALEKEKIYLKDVPDDFITITSGLGDANPRCILISPLIFNDELFGVIELASFRLLKSFEIDFVDKLAEILASTISRAKTNEQTQNLLRDSQKLTEELRAQEEEMRQNLEEMNATQEEMQQREVERVGIFTAINNTLATVEFSMEGNITNANGKFLEMMGYSPDEVINKTDRIFADKNNEPIEVYNEFWKQLREGKLQNGDFKRITKNGREIWLNASYTPALNKDGVPYKVIELATDKTEKKNAELETQRQAEELRTQGEKLKTYTNELEDIKKNLSEKLNEASTGLKKKIQDIEIEKAKNIAILEGCVDGVISFDHTGITEYFNNAAEEIWGIQRDKVLGEKIDTIIPLSLEQNNGTLKAYSISGESKKELDLRTEISWVDKDGKEYDLLVTLTRAKVNNNETFTIFAQKISVDLF
jgi:PAS domain S-box-containing protein